MLHNGKDINLKSNIFWRMIILNNEQKCSRVRNMCHVNTTWISYKRKTIENMCVFLKQNVNSPELHVLRNIENM